MKTLNLFYAEPDPDRWLAFDRYPRRLVRRIVRGRSHPSGQALVFLNLRAGLDQMGVSYRLNDYAYARANPGALVCLVGKSLLLDKPWENPILFGAAGDRHPIDDPTLFKRLDVRRVLVPCSWVVEMFRPYWGTEIFAWPVGIDTDRWRPSSSLSKSTNVLLYDKIRWDHAHYEETLLNTVRQHLRLRGLTFQEIRYGYYQEEQFRTSLENCQAMIFLCEHETQGLAYQQALSCGVPILAWDRGGPWRDTNFYPDRVDFGPVTSVPYFDERCGRRFCDGASFPSELDVFWDEFQAGAYAPRDFVIENLTLKICARAYLDHVRAVT